MPNINNPGSFLYPSGTETSVIASGTQVVALTTGDLNNPKFVLTNGRGASLQFPGVSGTAYTPGQSHFTGINHEASYPLAIRNGGVQGYEATLEKVLAPGAQFSFTLLSQTSGTAYGQAYTAQAGLWGSAYQPNANVPPEIYGLQRLAWNIQDPTLNMGTSGVSLPITISTSGRQAILLPPASGQPTLGMFIFTDTSHNVLACALQVGANGTSPQMGVKVQLQAAAGSGLTIPVVQKLNSTQALVRWWDPTATTNKNIYAIATVVSGTPPTLSIGSTSNDTAAVAASGSRIGLTGVMAEITPDAGGNAFWQVGLNSTSPYVAGAYFLTVSGTAVTVAAVNSNYSSGTTNNGNVNSYKGYSPAANHLLTFGNNINASGQAFPLNYLSVSGAVISSVWEMSVISLASSTPAIRVEVVDSVNGYYLIIAGQANVANIGVLTKLDLVTPNIDEWTQLLGFNYDLSNIGLLTAIGSPTSFDMIGEGELLTGPGGGTQSQATSNFSTYFDIRKIIRNGPISTTSTPSQVAVNGQTAQILTNPVLSNGNGANASILGFSCDQQTRRAVMIYTGSELSGAGSQPNTYLNASFFEFPKR